MPPDRWQYRFLSLGSFYSLLNGWCPQFVPECLERAQAEQSNTSKDRHRRMHRSNHRDRPESSQRSELVLRKKNSAPFAQLRAGLRLRRRQNGGLPRLRRKGKRWSRAAPALQRDSRSGKGGQAPRRPRGRKYRDEKKRRFTKTRNCRIGIDRFARERHGRAGARHAQGRHCVRGAGAARGWRARGDLQPARDRHHHAVFPGRWSFFTMPRSPSRSRSRSRPMASAIFISTRRREAMPCNCTVRA